MKLTEEYLESKMHYIQQLVESHEIEDKEGFIEEIKEEYEKVSKRRSAKILGPDVIFMKALGAVMAKISTAGRGEKFNVFIMGYTNPRDWNQESVEEILKAWQSGPKARHKLITEGKIATIKKGEETIVLSKIKKFQISSKTKRFVPIAGEEIKEGELPIPIDTREKLNDDRENKKVTYPLRESWNTNVFGVVEINETYKPFELSVYGDMAKPTSDKFLPNNSPAFAEYTIIATINDERTNEECMYLQYLNGINKVKSETDISPEEIIYGLLNQDHIRSYKATKGEIDKYSYKTIYMVDLDDIKDFHNELIAKRDKKGNIIKNPSGYDKTHFTRFGIGIYHCSSKTETERGNFNLRFSDYTGKNNGLFTPDYMEEPEIIDYPQEVLISFKTTKKPTRWDAENKVSIDDPINGDVTLGSLLGIRILKPVISDEE